MAEQWLKRAIGAGFQGLVALRLDGAPAADAVTKTFDIWLIALTKNREWDEEQDAARIRATFETLFSSCEKWPSPARFLRDLRPRDPLPELPKPERTDAQLRTGNAALDGIVARLKGRSGTNRVVPLKTAKQFEYSRQAAGLIAAAELQRADDQTNTEQHN